MLSIYYSLIYSHLYGIEIWGFAFKKDIDKVLVLQKRAIRLITFNDKFPDNPGPSVPTDPLVHQLRKLKVGDVHMFQILKFVYKSLHKLVPDIFHDWFQLNSERHPHILTFFTGPDLIIMLTSAMFTVIYVYPVLELQLMGRNK